MSIDVYLLVAGCGAALAGFVRGYSGFGSGMIMVPIFSLMYDPRFAVVSAVIMELIASIQLVPDAIAKCDWRSVIPMSLSSLFAIPLGSLLLMSLDAQTMTRCIAVVVLASVVLLAIKPRAYDKHRRGPLAAYITGASSGVVSGATSLGGLPVILYYLSGNLSSGKSRASMVVFLVVTAVVTLLAFVWHGIISKEILLFSAMIAPPFAISIWLGKRLFGSTPESSFRRSTLLLLGALGLILLFA